MVIFIEHHLFKNPICTKLDQISRRNLSIYLNAKLQRKLLPYLHYTLKSKGELFPESYESISDFITLLQAIEEKWKILSHKPSTVIVHPASDLSFDSPEKNTRPSSLLPGNGATNIFARLLSKRYVTPSETACIGKS